jgi:hypothetical protein
MTDARLPERWLNARKFRRLTDREWRSYTHALMWSVANRTDGVIEHRDIGDIPGFDPACVPAFVDAGIWSRIDDGWLIADYLTTQSSRAQLERDDRNRERNRERQRRHRAKPETADSGHVTRDITGDHAGQDRTGQDRKATRAPKRKRRKQARAKRLRVWPGRRRSTLTGCAAGAPSRPRRPGYDPLHHRRVGQLCPGGVPLPARLDVPVLPART